MKHTYPHCTGSCDQGRRLCQTPQACALPEPDEDHEMNRIELSVAIFAVVTLTVIIAYLAFL